MNADWSNLFIFQGWYLIKNFVITLFRFWYSHGFQVGICLQSSTNCSKSWVSNLCGDVKYFWIMWSDTVKNIPETVTISPGLHNRVRSPRQWTVIDRGICPTGTWSGSSWMRISWYLMKRDPLVCIWSCPVVLLSWQRWEGHFWRGINWFPEI